MLIRCQLRWRNQHSHNGLELMKCLQSGERKTNCPLGNDKTDKLWTINGQFKNVL
ncbi:hypothetical protein CsSME_00034321 [Camellia sinensis var. sinensis]